MSDEAKRLKLPKCPYCGRRPSLVPTGLVEETDGKPIYQVLPCCSARENLERRAVLGKVLAGAKSRKRTK